MDLRDRDTSQLWNYDEALRKETAGEHGYLASIMACLEGNAGGLFCTCARGLCIWSKRVRPGT